ncbi:chemotaxis protein CheA [Pelagicoccus sp. SDUM812003]|uniref:chemotaxis protein CheA n=1 Tax=Pelagicoccus sp. SDUM812003 TaxID=3041267 RepID=UPI0028106652|nr:chemotaxis protein CheA [Pelagicoccus sp. SDUM812003]MDQ8201560.1 chemotaxis protein CheA [Pelagicoccus sp. SDUM812003]
MAWSPDEITKFEDIASKLTSESHLAKPETDNGLIPIFSLVNEITWSLPQDEHLTEAVVAIQEMLQPMLDEATLFDAATIEAMQSFAKWCCDSVDKLRNEQPLTSYLATDDETPAVAEPIEQETAEAEAAPTKLPGFGDIDFSTALEQEPAKPAFSCDDDFSDIDFEKPEETPAPTGEADSIELTPVSEEAGLDDIQLTPLEKNPGAEEQVSAPEAVELTPVADEPTNDSFVLNELNDNWPLHLVESFSKIAQQFSAELLLASKDSDEGMLPVYSLLKDLDSEFDSKEIVQEAVTPVLDKMDTLLDTASAYDEYAIQILTEFNVWLETALAEINAGRDPQPFTPSPEADPLPETADSTSDDLPEDDGLLAEFAQYDIVMDLNMEENEELLQEFHTEAVDHLGQIESAVLELEQDVTSRDAINSMFRSFHTIKGVAGFLNLVPVNRLAHEVESLMDLVRNDKLDVFTGIIDLVLAAKDTITQLIDQITQALANGTLPSQVIPVSELMARARWAMEGPEHYVKMTGDSNAASSNAAAKEDASPAKSAIAADESAEDSSPEEASQAEAPAQDSKIASAAKRKAAENATIRVNTWKLDNLMDMVGELVIVQSQLLESSRGENASDGNSVFQRNMSQLTRITKELQHTSMALRMIPVKQTFQKMGRIVRDIGAKCGKKVRFETFGEDTELDRNVVEEIGDPLVHMVRNALDHGLEATSDDRVAAGKDETGTISLKAYHQGSNIVIELTDDGRGIDPEKVLKKAIANGIVDEGDQLPKEEIYKLIFAPGFSTAEKITDISGRGVGMDVVRKNIEKLRGKVEIESELGKGSTFRILLPLTMAIVDGLVVKVGEDRFILPTTSVKVALRPDETVLAKIQGNQEILNIRGKVIPLFRLHQHFAIPGAISNPKDATVVVVETGGKPCGLLVDDMVSKQEVVIKSLGGMMQGIPGVSGGAILGDGTIALILDPASLINVA